MVGKAKNHKGVRYVDVVIELPDGSIKTFEEPLSIDEENATIVPITPAHVSELITKNNF